MYDFMESFGAEFRCYFAVIIQNKLILYLNYGLGRLPANLKLKFFFVIYLLSIFTL